LTLEYKALFHIAMLLISSPARAWEEIRLHEDKQKVFSTFVYPMIGFCGLSVFIGAILSMGWEGAVSFQYAMTRCCAIAVSLFGGYFLAAYLINAMGVQLFKMESDMILSHQFAGYSLVVLFLLQMIIGLLPDFGIIGLLLQFYTVFVVWEGASVLMEVQEKQRLRFTIFSSILLLLCPFLIQLIFNKLMLVFN